MQEGNPRLMKRLLQDQLQDHDADRQHEGGQQPATVSGSHGQRGMPSIRLISFSRLVMVALKLGGLLYAP